MTTNQVLAIWERIPVTDEGFMLKRYEETDRLVKAAKADAPPPQNALTLNEFLNACVNGDLPALKASDLQCFQNTLGIRGLEFACFYGHLPVVKYLLEEQRIDGYICNIIGSPFVSACRNGHLPIVQYLAGLGPSMNKSAYYEAGFISACQAGYLATAQYLSPKGVNLCAQNYKAYRDAKSNDHRAVVEWLESIGGAPQKPNVITVAEFMDACKIGRIDSLKASDVSLISEDNKRTAFSVACKNGKPAIVKYLLEKFEPNLTAGIIQEGFDDACTFGHLDVVKCLVDRPDRPQNAVDIHANSERGFRIACANNKLAIVKYLVSMGADIHAVQNSGYKTAKQLGFTDVTNYLASIAFK